MLRGSVAACPDGLWDDPAETNRFWQVAYHALYFTHLYLHPHLDAFTPWPRHQASVQHEDGIAGPVDPESELSLVPDTYSKADVLAYCDFCVDLVDGSVDRLDLTSSESGFFWYSVPKFEHQLVNLRHLQHHAAQLADRLRNRAGLGTRWVATRPR